MIVKAVQWLVKEDIFGKMKKGETPLTASSARAMLDDYISRIDNKINKVIEKLDEQRLGQLLSGLSQLRDSVRTSLGRHILTNALDNFHKIISIPPHGRTGGFKNGELRSLAFLGIAAIHQLLNDETDLIAEKIVMAVEADPVTAEQFIDKRICMAILRRILPGQFFQLSGSMMSQEILFPTNCMYFVAPGPGLRTPRGHSLNAHFWVRQEIAPITGFPLYRVGLTRYSAQYLTAFIIVKDFIPLPKLDSKVRQMKKYGKLEVALGEKVPFYAPLSGRVVSIRDDLRWWEDRFEILTQDPYGEGWLFVISPNGITNRERLNRELANLINANAYRNFISTDGNPRMVNVNSITYTTKGGRNKDKDLVIRIALVDHFGNPVSDATIEIDVSLVGEKDWYKFKGTTGSDGTVIFIFDNAPSGCYFTTVSSVKVDNLSFCKDATPRNKFYK